MDALTLWHYTFAESYVRIWRDGFIRPMNDGYSNVLGF